MVQTEPHRVGNRNSSDGESELFAPRLTVSGDRLNDASLAVGKDPKVRHVTDLLDEWEVVSAKTGRVLPFVLPVLVQTRQRDSETHAILRLVFPDRRFYTAQPDFMNRLLR